MISSFSFSDKFSVCITAIRRTAVTSLSRVGVCASPARTKSLSSGRGLTERVLEGLKQYLRAVQALTFLLFHLPSVVSVGRYSKKSSASGWNTNKPLSPPLRKPSRTRLYWLNSGSYGKRNTQSSRAFGRRVRQPTGRPRPHGPFPGEGEGRRIFSHLKGLF